MAIQLGDSSRLLKPLSDRHEVVKVVKKDDDLLQRLFKTIVTLKLFQLL